MNQAFHSQSLGCLPRALFCRAADKLPCSRASRSWGGSQRPSGLEGWPGIGALSEWVRNLGTTKLSRCYLGTGSISGLLLMVPQRAYSLAGPSDLAFLAQYVDSLRLKSLLACSSLKEVVVRSHTLHVLLSPFLPDKGPPLTSPFVSHVWDKSYLT